MLKSRWQCTHSLICRYKKSAKKSVVCIIFLSIGIGTKFALLIVPNWFVVKHSWKEMKVKKQRRKKGNRFEFHLALVRRAGTRFISKVRVSDILVSSASSRLSACFLNPRPAEKKTRSSTVLYRFSIKDNVTKWNTKRKVAYSFQQ